MTLAAGARLGPYEILSSLGAGGMGEVYKARDSRLGRDVAIKVLPEEFARDAERLRRFEGEARAASSVSDPHIVTVFDVGNEGGVSYFASELVVGSDLRGLLGEPIPLKKTLDLAEQIASGLAAAHEMGIVHRDLKPENVLVSRSGLAKIADFGLAKLTETPGSQLSQAPTSDGRQTTAGVVMGTVAYMSPEQARGAKIDFRSDQFAFGAILFEMLTGNAAFQRSSPAETLSAILREEPEPLARSAPAAPAPLRWVADRCLSKEPEGRYSSTADLAKDLRAIRERWSESAALSGSDAAPLAARASPRGRLALAAILAAATIAAGLAGGFRLGRRSAGSPGSSSLEQATLTPLTTDPGYEGDPTFSPDGQTIAYASDRSGNLEIYLQQIAGGPALNLTNNPADDTQPAFSPDGKQIAFVSSRARTFPLSVRGPELPLMGGDVWVMPALGGPAKRVVEAASFPSWSPDGKSVLFVRGNWFKSEIARVPVDGGPPLPIRLELPKNVSNPPWLLWPVVSPDGQWLAFEARDFVCAAPAAGGTSWVVAPGRRPSWGADGKSLIFTSTASGRAFGLWRFPLDPATGEPSGPASPLTFGPGETAGAAISRSGERIVFAAPRRDQNVEAMPFDADGAGAVGREYEVTVGEDDIRFFHPSPDGRQIAAELQRGAENHVWKLERGAAPVQLTTDPGLSENWPRWSPDGRLIAFLRGDALWLMSSDGANQRPLGRGISRGRFHWLPDSRGLIDLRDGDFFSLDLKDGAEHPLSHGLRSMPFFDVSADRNWIAYQSAEGASVDIRVLSLADGSTRTVVETPRDDYHPFFSPLGRWLYFTPEHKNIYRVPGPAQAWRGAVPEAVTNFSEAGLYMEEPQISLDGRTLFFVRGRTVSDLWLLELHPRSGRGLGRG